MGAQQTPHDIELEQALLGAILMNNDAHHVVSGWFNSQFFYEPVHSQIYDAIERFIKVGKKADPKTVRTQLPEELTPDMNMSAYLASLCANAVTVLNARDYAHVLRDLAIKRGIISISDGMAHEATKPDSEASAEQQIENAERHLYDLQKTGVVTKGFQNFSVAVADAVEMTAAAFKRDGNLSGIATGLSDLDRLMGGLQNSDLVVLAGRPAMGKTALATNIAFHVASQYSGNGDGKADNGGRVGFFSLEMSASQLAQRILSEQSGIPSSDLRRGAIHQTQFAAFADAAGRVEACPLSIDDTGGLAVAQVAARSRRLKRQGGLDLIVIDYLQLLSGSAKKSDNRVQEMTEITTSLKALAKELDVPILALSQLSRQVENREDKRPQLSDLRESGSIEQDADVVMFVYRDEYYLKNKEPKENTKEYFDWQAQMELVAGKADVIIGKQRHGPTGTVQLAFNPMLTRFQDLAKDAYTPERVA